MFQPTRGVVAAGHPITAEAGKEILNQGGNAFDAAVAAVFTACVTESVLTSVAGGGFLLAHTEAGENILFDFFTQTPRCKDLAAPPDFYPIEANFGDTTQEFHIGLGSIAIPGTLAGLLHVHRRLGRLPLSEVITPAVHWAKTGFEIDAFRAYCLELLTPILLATPEARRIYAPAGQVLGLGDRFTLPDFAQTLLHLVASEGRDFYEGTLAHQVAQDCQARGGYVTLTDLISYQVLERQPLRLRYRDSWLLTNPPPSSGGTLIAFALKLLSQSELGRYDFGSPAHVKLLTAAMGLTNQARRDGYDANLYQPNIEAWFLSEPHMAAYHHNFQETVNKWGSTTHVSVLDEDGNAASVTTSNGEGSSYIIPGTGIMMNNMLGEEDLNPHGFHQWKTNQRMSSMMSPTIILHQGKPQLVLGSGGSNRIRTAILQVISNVLDFGMTLEEAVVAPRLHWEQETLHLEPGYNRSALETMSLCQQNECIWWQQPNMFFGGVHAAAVSATGLWQGVGDSRRGGASLS